MTKGFTEGVDRDGLKDISEIKDMICYLLASVDEPLTRATLNDILQEDYSLANYFEVNEALSKLIKDGSVLTQQIGDEEYLTLEKSKREEAVISERRLPRTTREKAINCAVRLLTQTRRKRENKIEIKKLDKGYNVTFTLFDVNTEFMKLTMYVSDIYQAEKVKENFLKDPVNFYSGIITFLTKE